MCKVTHGKHDDVFDDREALLGKIIGRSEVRRSMVDGLPHRNHQDVLKEVPAVGGIVHVRR